MNEDIRQLAPTELWNHFADLNAVPRPSKKEQRVIAFMQSFGKSLGLATSTDEAGNVVIKKPASKGMEDRQTVVLQSHLDMVHQKNSDRVFDFEQQGIEMYIDGDWVKAKGTTLGADNGIGVATIMSLLAAKDIPHPALEALFTIDEETGLTGALALKGGVLSGNILLNLDTEEDNVLTIGCAGGVDVTGSGFYDQLTTTGGRAFRISVKGLTGGHSGGDIHLGRGNANKLMNRILYELGPGIGIASINGGSLRNAIPRESVAVIVTTSEEANSVQAKVNNLADILKNEFKTTDPGLTVIIEATDMPSQIMDARFQFQLLRAVYAVPHGIYRMSPDIPGLVQSSNNLSRIIIENGTYSIQCLTRSSVNTEKGDVANTISSALQLIESPIVDAREVSESVKRMAAEGISSLSKQGLHALSQFGSTVNYNNDYPGWEPKPDAPIIQLMSGLYKELFHEPVLVAAVHAGLECGILGTHYPDMQMISFGPNILGAHSPDERAQISSVQKFWQFLLETLKRIPKK